jgi:perosamine synthetase
LIPRFSPTYSLPDLFKSLKARHHGLPNEQLCSRIAALHGVKYSFLLDSARLALYVLLKAYNHPGGVILPAYTCIVVPQAIHDAGYRPIFLDIEKGSLGLDPQLILKSLSDEVTVVLVTHLLGIPNNPQEILPICQERGILVLEDAAPALGAKIGGRLVGTIGDASIISFQSTKIISGETGGAIITNNSNLADRINHVLKSAALPSNNWLYFIRAFFRKIATNPKFYRILQRSYGLFFGEEMFEVVKARPAMPSTFLRQCPSFSSKLILSQFDRLEWNLSRRAKIASIYQSTLKELPWLKLPTIPEESSPAWIQFSFFADDKKSFYKYMQSKGIDLSWTYRYSCADSYRLEGFPNARKAAETILGFPCYPMLTDEQAHSISHLARKYNGD